MNIRPMKLEDITEIIDIEKSLFTIPWTTKDFEEAVGEETTYTKIYLVAEEDEKIIGYCGMWGIANEGQINNVAVKKTEQNKHVGRTLLNELIKISIEKAIYDFTLEVRISNNAAIKLYQNLGFNNAGIRKGFYDSPKEDAIIMWLHKN